MQDFFVSHASADHAWAEWIAWRLEERGYSTTLQAWDFLPGSNFVLEMQKASSGAKRTLAVLSKAYLQRLYTQSEWAAAFASDPIGSSRRLIPVRIEPCELEGLLAQIVYIDLASFSDENQALATLLEGIGRVESGRGKPDRPPPFPVSARRPFPGGVVSRLRRFIHAQVTAQGLLNLNNLQNPYSHLLDPTSSVENQNSSGIFSFLWLPRAEYLRSRTLQSLTPAAAICTAEPRSLVGELREIAGANEINKVSEPPADLRRQEKETLLSALGVVLPECFIAAIVVPDLVLGIGRQRAQFGYQALTDLFLGPLVEMHKRIGFEKFNLRLSHVGDKDAFLLQIAKGAIREWYPRKGSTTTTFAEPHSTEAILINMGRLLAWAVGAFYNSGETKWLKLLDDTEL